MSNCRIPVSKILDIAYWGLFGLGFGMLDSNEGNESVCDEG